MAHILLDKTGRCFCNCADKCVVEHKSGMSARCTKEEIEASGHRVVQVYNDKSDKAIMDFNCIDGDEKKIKVELVRL